MTATTRIIIPTKSLVKLSTNSPRAAVKDAVNVLSGASAGSGQGKGINVTASATVATDDGVANPGGTSMAGGVVWVSGVESTNAPKLQLGAPINSFTLPAPDSADSVIDYANTVISELVGDGDIRQNLDVDFGTTPLVYTQVAAAVQLDNSIPGGLVSGDKIVVCGVEFTGLAADYSAVDKFDINAAPGDPDRWENKVGNHPTLCGKIIPVQGQPTNLYFGSPTPIPQLPFSFQLVSNDVSVLYVTPDWIDGGGGAVDPIFGTPLVMFFESNENQYEAGWGFSFDAADNGGLAPISDPMDPTVSGFNGTATDNPPTVTAAVGNASLSPTPTHTLEITISQKTVTSHYIETAPMAQLISGSESTTVQNLVRLLQACLSGTGLASRMDAVELVTTTSGVSQQTVTWTVGSR